jgi:hypothetical protein
MALASCGGDNADRDGDGKVSREERAAEMASDGYLSMQPGRWKMKVDFTEIDVPRLGNKEKQSILRKAAEESSSLSCLSKADAAKPSADFFGGRGAERCIYTKFDIAGDRARMTVSCRQGDMGKVEMELDGSVGDTQIEFDTNLTVSAPIVGKIKLKGKMTGTHDGPCLGNE